MNSDESTRPYPSSESVGDFYDQMGAFFASIFGEDIHFGIWDGDETLSMAEAQTRLTDHLIDLLGLQAGEYLLDVGCGTGNPARRLAERTGARVLGVSVSPSQVESATAKAKATGLGTRLEFVEADAMQLPYADGTFDAAWAIEMLFHVPSRLQVLREIHRTLKPGGRVVLADFVERRQVTGAEWNVLREGFAFSSLLRPGDYAGVVADAGLEVIQVHDVTAETRHNIAWIRSRHEAGKEDLARHYGLASAGQIDRLLTAGMDIYTEKLGYVVVEARRAATG
ncbi:SAM-dependent methyltransferase [Streptomyces lavendulae]|uniref:SAM-dependent methyltransferase n=1 Tax=Streptomyces lavendulae TaxID=1914 RepID=UPI0036ED50D7